jgi:hypothetical protein
MGMDQKVVFAADRLPSWSSLAEFLVGRGFAVELRMIDGELSFPDETPPEQWRELRLGTPGGMVTMRREPDGITLVTWGNADVSLRQSWHALAYALARLTAGTVATASGPLSADQFASSVALPFSPEPGR